MSFNCRNFHSTLRSTVVCSAMLVFFTPFIAHAFNPNEGATPTTNRSTRARLPSTTPLISPMARLTFPDANAPRFVPQENSLVPMEAANANRPKLAFPENTLQRQTPSENYNTLPVNPPGSFPPVEAATVYRAEQEIAGMPTALVGRTATSPGSFIAPAPLIAPSPAYSAPITSTAGPVSQLAVLPETLGQAAMLGALPANLSALPSEPATLTSPPLSDVSKKVLGAIPSKIGTTTPKGGKLAISRMSPDLLALAKNPKIESFDSGGLSIKVQRPGLDTNFELNRAYTSLMGGESSAAIDTYKNIVSSEPNNEDALFGLASTYHRLGNLEQARPYYASLLKLNPNHREGLNNFLALISDESPQEALAELERLEQRNPDFSPIPAQQAVLLTKLGYADRAREKMLRAIELAPDNLTYKYNLAVMMDKSGNYADASALYRLLIDAALNGQKIPAPTASLQKRLNFIAAVRPTFAPIGG